MVSYQSCSSCQKKSISSFNREVLRVLVIIGLAKIKLRRFMSKMTIYTVTKRKLIFLDAVTSFFFTASYAKLNKFIVYSPERKLHSVAEPLRFLSYLIKEV